MALFTDMSFSTTLIDLLFQGIAMLVDDFNKRKQRLIFYKCRSPVLSVLHGAGLNDFEHVGSPQELEATLKGRSSSGTSSRSLRIPVPGMTFSRILVVFLLGFKIDL